MNDMASIAASLKTIRLGDVAEITMGQSPESANLNTKEMGLPFLQGCAEFGRHSPATTVYCNPPVRISKPDSILVSVRAPVGTLNWGEESYCIGRGLAAIKAASEVADTKYLFYVIAENVNFLHRRSQGSTFLAVGGNDLRLFPVPAFRVAKQKKIARILQTIDRAIEKTEALIDKYQQIKAGLMHDLFTRGIGPDGQLRPPREQAPELYQETSIGWIPKEWRGVLFGEVCDRKPQNGLYKPMTDYEETGVQIVRIDGFYDGRLCKPENFRRLRLSDAELRLYGLLQDDILINRVNSLSYIGKSAIVPGLDESLVFESNIMRCRMDQSRIAPQYAILWLCTPVVIAYFKRRAKPAVAQASINQADICSLSVPLPDREEQLAICERLAAIDDKIDCEGQRLDKLSAQRAGLMHDLLNGEAPVQVEPEAEPETAHV